MQCKWPRGGHIVYHQYWNNGNSVSGPQFPHPNQEPESFFIWLQTLLKVDRLRFTFWKTIKPNPGVLREVTEEQRQNHGDRESSSFLQLRIQRFIIEIFWPKIGCYNSAEIWNDGKMDKMSRNWFCTKGPLTFAVGFLIRLWAKFGKNSWWSDKYHMEPERWCYYKERSNRWTFSLS